MKKVLLTLVITLAILAVAGVLAGMVALWMPVTVIIACLMTMTGLLVFGMVWLCVWEHLSTRS
jgi:glucose-6-phosphate-specific signal transduction histidine kinase